MKKYKFCRLAVCLRLKFYKFNWITSKNKFVPRLFCAFSQNKHSSNARSEVVKGMENGYWTQLSRKGYLSGNCGQDFVI